MEIDITIERIDNGYVFSGKDVAVFAHNATHNWGAP